MRLAIVPMILAIVFFGLMFIPTIVGSILYFSGRPHSGVRRVGGSIVMVCGTVLAGLLILSTFTILFAVGMARVPLRDVPATPRTVDSPALPPAVAVLPESPHIPRAELKAEAESNIDAGLKRLPEAENADQPADATVPQAEQTVTTDTRPQPPAWTKAGDHRQGDVRHIVLTSKQYATLDEARNELAVTVRSLLSDDSLRVFQTDMASELASLPVSQLRSLAVKQEYSESSPTDFGTFIAGMHRVWWQVEISPEVRTKFRAIWKEHTQDVRTWIVGGVLIDLIVLLAGVSWFTRRRHAMMG